jgi:hypothetical protein
MPVIDCPADKNQRNCFPRLGHSEKYMLEPQYVHPYVCHFENSKYFSEKRRYWHDFFFKFVYTKRATPLAGLWSSTCDNV